jgi:hypothetical protein
MPNIIKMGNMEIMEMHLLEISSGLINKLMQLTWVDIYFCSPQQKVMWNNT